MAITRRTPRFRVLAEAIEAQCRRLGHEPDSASVDVILNARIELVAAHIRVQPRSALPYATADLVDPLARQVIADTEQRATGGVLDIHSAHPST